MRYTKNGVLRALYLLTIIVIFLLFVPFGGNQHETSSLRTPSGPNLDDLDFVITDTVHQAGRLVVAAIPLAILQEADTIISRHFIMLAILSEPPGEVIRPGSIIHVIAWLPEATRIMTAESDTIYYCAAQRVVIRWFIQPHREHNYPFAVDISHRILSLVNLS